MITPPSTHHAPTASPSESPPPRRRARDESKSFVGLITALANSRADASAPPGATTAPPASLNTAIKREQEASPFCEEGVFGRGVSDIAFEHSAQDFLQRQPDTRTRMSDRDTPARQAEDVDPRHSLASNGLRIRETSSPGVLGGAVRRDAVRTVASSPAETDPAQQAMLRLKQNLSLRPHAQSSAMTRTIARQMSPFHVALLMSEPGPEVSVRAGRMAPAERARLRAAIAALLVEHGFEGAAIYLDGRAADQDFARG